LRGGVGGNKLHSWWLICCLGPGFTTASRAGSMRVSVWLHLLLSLGHDLLALYSHIRETKTHLPITCPLGPGPGRRSTPSSSAVSRSTQDAFGHAPSSSLPRDPSRERAARLQPPLTLTGRLPAWRVRREAEACTKPGPPVPKARS
jgi:hypothetical protein